MNYCKIRTLCGSGYARWKDPDDYVHNHGGQAFKDLVAKAVKPLDYLLSESLIKHDTNDTEGKQAVMADVFPYIANIDSQTQRMML